MALHPYVWMMKTMMFRVGKVVAAGTVGVLLACSACVCSAQTALPPARPIAQSFSDPNAPRIDLDFGGGTPAQLVDAIEKATKEPLNAIIREEDKNVMLPPLKVRQVTIEDLFAALEQASRQRKAQVTGSYFVGSGGSSRSQYTVVDSSYGFKKQGNLWVFRHEKPTLPPDAISSLTRFYNLEPYLTKHTIEDVTTAIQTAWKMMAETGRSPESGGSNLKFHQETKLLIAVGDEAQVQVIDDALKALRPDLGSAQVNAPEPQRRTNAPVANPTSRE